MSSKELFFNKIKQAPRVALATGVGMALTLSSYGCTAEDPDVTIDPVTPTPITRAIEQAIKPPTADHPPIPSTPEEKVDYILNNPSKELSLTDYGVVFDFYFEKAMQDFKLRSKRDDPLYKTDGSAVFTTDTGYKYTLSRNHLRTGYTIQNGQSKATTALERTIIIENENKLPDYPGLIHNLFTRYTLAEDGKPERINTTKRIETGGNIILQDAVPKIMTPRELLEVATLLKKDLDKAKNTSLPQSFNPQAYDNSKGIKA